VGDIETEYGLTPQATLAETFLKIIKDDQVKDNFLYAMLASGVSKPPLEVYKAIQKKKDAASEVSEPVTTNMNR
jgi:hypothetical protein